MSVLDLFGLDGKVALITGGGRGLGEQMAHGLAQAGARIALGSRRVESCESVRDELKSQGADAVAFALDVTQPESVAKAVEQTLQVFGHIDILINNGGASWGSPAEEMPYEAWQKVLQTNLTGTFLMSQAVGRHMIPRRSGKIINIASIAGFRGSDPDILDAIGYSASKGGVIAFTRDLAVKWARHGICVNAIAPGFFPTKMTQHMLSQHSEAIVGGTPLRRVGGERDLQGAALYFASAASDFTTGQVLAVDGGVSVG
ncbi:MAG: SDR family oxidoreductase [Firmicutes bacterium]|nr:SDR family oxidoreductase [Bacillota bacterium]